MGKESKKEWIYIYAVLFNLQVSATPWTIAQKAHLSLEFSRQEYWSGLLFPSPENLPNPRIKAASPALQADSLLSESLGNLEINVFVSFI